MDVESQLVLDKFKPRDSLLGLKFGKWTVLKEVKKPKQSGRHYECQCECGTKQIIIASTLRGGHSKQCVKCNVVTHGLSTAPTYRIWAGLFTRCYNAKSKTYKYYGAKGITVCDRWHKFENFLADMGERPIGMQIDRINCDGIYEPSNCRWVTRSDNLKNMRLHTIDIINKKFGKWFVVERDLERKVSHAYYICKCDCGTIGSRSGADLRRGKTVQCIKCKNESHRGWFERYRVRTNEC